MLCDGLSLSCLVPWDYVVCTCNPCGFVIGALRDLFLLPYLGVYVLYLLSKTQVLSAYAIF